ncbi:DNA internalization-related competence protein ComEC/Rec2 [Beggiatoa sp. PS]|nr:DNA internalization-related competence protein ComEC/Rec2 [Beggiatoa sp. PS]
MRLGTLVFLCGILCCQTLPFLPDVRWAFLLFPFIVLAWKLPRYRLISLFAVGFLWTVWRADAILAQKLPKDLEGQDITITGEIIDLPQKNQYGWRFYFIPIPFKKWPNPSRLRLSWHGEPPMPLRPGQQWQLTVRLKRARGMMNPGGFDYEGWLFQQRIRATGYVRPKGKANLLSEPSPFYIDNLRYRLAQEIQKSVGEYSSAGMIKALALGIKHDISKAQTTTLRHTGTAHLMAISGLHIGFVAWLTFFIGRWFWRYAGKATLWLPAPRFAALFSLSAAFCYALLAGFSLPTQRALIMIAIAISGIVFARTIAISHILALALLAVLLWAPLSVMSAGFWLSFSSVAVIVYFLSGRRVSTNSLLSQKGIATGKVHWAATLGLFPIILMISGYISFSSLPANAIAIPWVSFVVVPLTLLGTAIISFLPTEGSLLLRVAAYTLDTLWVSMIWFENVEWGVLQWTIPPFWTILVAMVGIAILLLPRGFPGKWLGIFWLLPIFLVPFPHPNQGEVWLDLLDVGQGLAAVVRTQNYTLVYDTGPKFSKKFDTGEAVVIPFLRSQGRLHIDKLLISHGDNDHIGGTQSILETLSVNEVLTSATQDIKKILEISGMRNEFPKHKKNLLNLDILKMRNEFPKHDTRVISCQTGQYWHWDGVTFQIIHPAANYFTNHRNDKSCVLKVSTKQHSILLTGDIENGVESRLVRQFSKNALQADIIIAPHHGSGTSSTEHFLNAVQPKIALFSAGYRNRFKHPKMEVVQRYHRQKINTWNTAQTGAISFRLSVDGISKPRLAREEMRRYWHD